MYFDFVQIIHEEWKHISLFELEILDGFPALGRVPVSFIAYLQVGRLSWRSGERDRIKSSSFIIHFSIDTSGAILNLFHVILYTYKPLYQHQVSKF